MAETEPFDALAEMTWVARTASELVAGELDRTAAADYFDRKSRLLDHLASTGPLLYPEAAELAAVARENARILRAGLEWPPAGGTLSWDTA